MKIKVEIDGQTYQVEVEDVHTRPIVAFLDGERYEVWPELDQGASPTSASLPDIAVPVPLQSTPGQPAQAGSRNDVAAPLPGVIVAVLVKEGDAVARGQELFTLEAMKMKNAIKSSRDGVIGDIAVNVGDQVNHGQVLMTFKE
jgi:biotin carboxyl carrier protein